VHIIWKFAYKYNTMSIEKSDMEKQRIDKLAEAPELPHPKTAGGGYSYLLDPRERELLKEAVVNLVQRSHESGIKTVVVAGPSGYPVGVSSEVSGKYYILTKKFQRCIR